MPKASTPCRLFPIRGNRGALTHSIGDRRFGSNLQQSLALLIGQFTTAGQGAIDIFLARNIPINV